MIQYTTPCQSVCSICSELPKLTAISSFAVTALADFTLFSSCKQLTCSVWIEDISEPHNPALAILEFAKRSLCCMAGQHARENGSFQTIFWSVLLTGPIYLVSFIIPSHFYRCVHAGNHGEFA
jgi:hypothetical protein